MPNKKISIKAGIIAGVITGVLFQLVQSAYLALQIGASSYNAIYGSFAALPLFLIWLQIVWVVVLFGCEISFYVHNFESYRHNEKFSNLSYFLKKNIAIQVCHCIVNRFANSEQAPTAECIADKLQLPLSIINRSLSELIKSNIIVELKSEDENISYQPAYDINKLTIFSVIHALEVSGINNIPGELQQQQISTLSSIDENSLLKDIQYNQV
jgi:membrane protein